MSASLSAFRQFAGETLITLAAVTLGVIGAILAPTLAAIGAIAALVTSCTIVVEKGKE